VTTRIVKCDGIVLRNLRYGDTSRVATLFTLEFGKLSVIAKGARSLKTPFGASLEILNHSSYVIYLKSGRDLQLVKDGSVEQEFTQILRNSKRFLFGCAILETLDRMLLEEEPTPALFRVSLKALSRAETVDPESLPELFRAFQLRAAGILGYAPMLDQCLLCRREVARLEDTAGEERAWFFRPSQGGSFCPDCADASESGYPMTARALLRIRAMSQGAVVPTAGTEPGGGAPGNGGNGRVQETVAAAPQRTPSPSDGVSRGRWVRTLDGLVEEYLRYHVARYRGLRSLDGRALEEYR